VGILDVGELTRDGGREGGLEGGAGVPDGVEAGLPQGEGAGEDPRLGPLDLLPPLKIV